MSTFFAPAVEFYRLRGGKKTTLADERPELRKTTSLVKLGASAVMIAMTLVVAPAVSTTARINKAVATAPEEVRAEKASFVHAVNEGFSVMQSDPQAWRQYQAEASDWDTTLLDGDA